MQTAQIETGHVETGHIQTGRLSLRPVRREDAPRIAELIADYDIARMLAGVPWPYRLEDAEAFTARLTDSEREQSWVIEHPDEGLIGMTGFHLTEGERFPEFGYWLGRDYWGRGYATEANAAALAWARRDWGKKAVRSGHFVENDASARVLVKCGFLYTGEVRSRPSLARGEDADTRMMVWLA